MDGPTVLGALFIANLVLFFGCVNPETGKFGEFNPGIWWTSNAPDRH
jgi:hypothetical protein